MRISTSQVFLSNLDNLTRTNTELFKTQQQLSTGKKVLQPSDDPLAAAQIIKLKKEVARNDQFQGNIDVSRRRLELEEIALDQLNNINIRLREITIQAGNGVLSAADRESLATEVDEMTQQMLGLMNTKDAQGEYLFAGFKGGDAAYVKTQVSMHIRATAASAISRSDLTTALPPPTLARSCSSRLKGLNVQSLPTIQMVRLRLWGWLTRSCLKLQ